MAERRLLEGVRILDCGSWIAGSAAATIASDFGAEVIKVEPPNVGDNYRNQLNNMPYAPANSYDYSWFIDSRNKVSLTLNLKSDEGQKIFTSLVKTADVVLTNMPLKARARLKLTYEDVKAIKSDIIYASLTSFGELGPHAHDKGYDSTAFWPRSGIMDCLRGRGEKPRMSLQGQGDHSTSVALFAGIMLALFDRARTGEGRMVSTSLLSNGIWSNALSVQGAATLAWYDSDSWDLGVVPLLRDSMYLTKDNNYVYINMIDRNEDFLRFLDLLDIRDKITGHPLYKPIDYDVPYKVEDETELIDIMQKALSHWNLRSLEAIMREQGLLLVWVNKLEDVKNDPQVIANKMIVDIDKEVFGVDKIVDSPLYLSDAIKEVRSPAPDLGQHTDMILKSMGYTEERISELRQQGVV